MKIDANCPECGYKVDDAAGVGDAKDDRPEPGNLGICIQCAGLGIYYVKPNGMLGLRLCTIEEKVELSLDEEVTSVRAAIAAQSVWFTP